MSHNTPSWCSIWTTVTRSKTPTSEADVPKVSTTNRFADEHKDALVDNFRYDVGYNRVLFLISQGQALKLQHIIGLVSSFLGTLTNTVTWNCWDLGGHSNATKTTYSDFSQYMGWSDDPCVAFIWILSEVWGSWPPARETPIRGRYLR